MHLERKRLLNEWIDSVHFIGDKLRIDWVEATGIWVLGGTLQCARKTKRRHHVTCITVGLYKLPALLGIVPPSSSGFGVQKLGFGWQEAT